MYVSSSLVLNNLQTCSFQILKVLIIFASMRPLSARHSQLSDAIPAGLWKIEIHTVHLEVELWILSSGDIPHYPKSLVYNECPTSKFCFRGFFFISLYWPSTHLSRCSSHIWLRSHPIHGRVLILQVYSSVIMIAKSN